MRILIIGGGGKVGRSLLRSAPEDFELFATYHRERIGSEAKEFECALEKPNAISQILQKVAPDVIIYAAALTDRTLCKEQPALAQSVNASAVEECAAYCGKTHAYLLYLSTSYVFSGKKGNYGEEDLPDPLDVYGKSKVMGERAALSCTGPKAVIRMSHFGVRHKGKLLWPFDVLMSGTVLKAHKGRQLNSLFTDDAARIIWDVVEQRLIGVYHVGSSDFYSWKDLLATLVRELGTKHSVDEVDFDKSWIPQDTTLNIKKIKAHGLLLPTMRETVRHALSAYRMNKP